MKTQQTKVWSVTNNRGATMHVYATDAPEAIALAEKNGFGPVSKAIIDRALTFEEPTATSAQASGNCRASHSPLPDRYKHHNYNIDVRNLTKGQLLDSYLELKAHAQRLADALNGLLYSKFEQQAFETAREALAQYNESSADADALEALDQLEQLEGGE